MPGQLHDWQHVYWRNRHPVGSEDSRVFDEEDIDPDERVLSIYENEAGERVALEYIEFEEIEVEPEDDAEDAEGEAESEPEIRRGDAVAPPGVPSDTEAKYAVTYNGEVVRNIELGEPVNAKLDAMVFETRAEGREAGLALRRAMPPIDEEKLEEIEDFEELVSLAKPRGFSRNDGRDAIVEGLTAIAQ